MFESLHRGHLVVVAAGQDESFLFGGRTVMGTAELTAGFTF
jgi:hypothetical protein